MRRIGEEEGEEKNGRSLGIGLASSLLLYKAAAKREWGHKARRREKKSPHQYASNPRADAFMSPFSILSLSLLCARFDTAIQRWWWRRQAAVKKKKTKRRQFLYIYTTRQKWFQDDDDDDDRLIAAVAAYVLVKYTYDAIYTITTKKKKKKRTPTTWYYVSERVN